MAVITGASRGLGRALAHALEARGWRLVVDARNASGPAEALPSATVIEGDVTDPVHRDALVPAVDVLGRLDRLVNNAGDLGPSPLPPLAGYPLDGLRVTFGDGSHPQNWAVVSDTGGKAEVLGNSFVGPTDCTKYGGPCCIYPWFSSDGSALNYGVSYPNTVDNFGKVNQFQQTPTCPEDGVFAGPTYCDRIVS